MSRLYRYGLIMLLVLLASVLTSCQGRSTAEPTVSTPAARVTTTSPLGASTAGLPSPTPRSHAASSPTPRVPPPPISRSLLPTDWLSDPDLGGAKPPEVLAFGRGYTTSAAVHPTEPVLALGRISGAYLCHFPTDPTGNVPLDCFQFLPHKGWVTSLAFTPDGRYLATLDVTSTLRLWDLTADPPRPTLAQSAVGNLQLAISPDGRYLAVAGGYEVELWDLQTKTKRLLGEPFSDSGVVNFVSFHPTLPLLAATGTRGQSAQINLAAIGAGWETLVDEEPLILSMAYTAASSPPLLAMVVSDPVIGDQTYLEFYDLQGRQGSITLPKAPRLNALVTYFELEKPGPRLIALGPEGALIVANGWETVAWYPPGTNRPRWTMAISPSVLTRQPVFVGYANQTHQVVGVWHDGSVVVADADSGRLQGMALDAGYLIIEGIGFDPLGRYLSFLKFSFPGPVLADLRSLQLFAPGFRITGARAMVQLDSCRSLLYTFDWIDDETQISSACSFVPSLDIFLPEQLFDAWPDVHPPTGWVGIVRDNAYDLQVWDLDTQELRYAPDLRATLGNVYSLAFSPDGRLLFVGGDDAQVGVLDAWTGELLDVWQVPGTPLEEGDDAVRMVAVADDGSRVVALRDDGYLAAWDPATGQEQLRFYAKALANGVTLHLSADGRFGFLAAHSSRLLFFALKERSVRVLATIEGPSMVVWERHAVGPDDRLWAYGHMSGNVLIVDTGPWMAHEMGDTVLPLPLIPEARAAAVDTFRSQYAVTLYLDGREHTLLDVQTTGQRTPWQTYQQVRGAAWPWEGEFAVALDQDIFGMQYRPAENRPWQSAQIGDLPPSAPVLRAGPWHYQGWQNERHIYTSTAPAAAAWPPGELLRRALDEPAAFVPETFQGRVALTDQALLVEADLEWEGILWVSQEPQSARIRVRYRVTDLNTPLEVPGPWTEDAAATDTTAGGTVEGPALIDPTTGVPLPPNSLATDDAEIFLVEMPKAEVIAWYEAQLPALGWAILQTQEKVKDGVEFFIFSVQGPTGTTYRIYIAEVTTISVIGIEQE